MMINKKVIGWFSCGVTSALAIKLAIEEYGIKNVTPIYFKIDQVHPDNERFIKQCEEWYGIKIHQIQGRFKTPIEASLQYKYINGPSGARCTMELKKALRQKIEREMEYDFQVFGFEFTPKEMNRAIRFEEQYPIAKPIFPLIKNRITKKECLYLLEKAGIKRPKMYELGYQNNNCIGCIKGGMGYWNKIRIDFPIIFQKTCEMERAIGASCIKGIYLDELDPMRGNHLREILPECGNFCEVE